MCVSVFCNLLLSLICCRCFSTNYSKTGSQYYSSSSSPPLYPSHPADHQGLSEAQPHHSTLHLLCQLEPELAEPVTITHPPPCSSAADPSPHLVSVDVQSDLFVDKWPSLHTRYCHHRTLTTITHTLLSQLHTHCVTITLTDSAKRH